MREQQTYFATKRQIHGKSRSLERSRWRDGGEDVDGATGVLDAQPGRGLGVLVQLRLEGVQQSAPAELRFDLVDADDEILASGFVVLGVDEHKTARSFRVRADPRIVRRHMVWGALLSCYETVHLRWQVQVVDATGRVLGRQTVEYEMRGA